MATSTSSQTKRFSAHPLRETVNVGVYIPSGAQLLDAACIDIIGTMSHEYLSLLQDILPAAIIKSAQSIKIYWIGAPKESTIMRSFSPSSYSQSFPPPPVTGIEIKDPSLVLMPMTAGANIVTTHTIASPEVQPGMLDVLVVPGPDPHLRWKEDVLTFLRGHAQAERKNGEKMTDVLSICTGIYLCGEAGILKGKTVCGPRGLQEDIRKRGYGENELVGDRYRWWRDGNIWSCGGVINGNDLVSYYMRTSGKFNLPAAEVAIEMCEVANRPHIYERSQLAVSGNMIWQVIRAWLGLGRAKEKGKRE